MEFTKMRSLFKIEDIYAKQSQDDSAQNKGIGSIYNVLGQRISIPQSNPLGIGVTAALPSSQTQSIDSVDYVGSFIYEKGQLKRYMFDDGYLKLYTNTFSPRFFIKDHLGNNRIVTDGSGNIQQNTNYYPYGGMTSISTGQGEQQFKYNGKEYDPMHGLNEYDYGARQYDPARGQFTTMDPLCEKYYHISPYAYCAGNPVNAVDPDGKHVEVMPYGTFENMYIITGGCVDDDLGIYSYYGKNNQKCIGKMFTKYSFMDANNSIILGAIIDMNDFSGQEFLNDFLSDTPNLLYYMPNALETGDYDFKNKGIPDDITNDPDRAKIYRNRGMSITINGKTHIASARDVGNFAAGYMAGMHDISWESARSAFDTLETAQQLKDGNNVKWYTEEKATQWAQKCGYKVGLNSRTAKIIKEIKSIRSLKDIYQMIWK